jgi:lipopolysaccharide transport system ATP-binding protein
VTDLLVKAEHVSKKFCRSLKRSLWYGLHDVAGSLNPFANSSPGTGSTSLQSSRPLRAQEFWALQDVSFEVRRGECLGLIGHNGAGKSTLLKMLNGLIRPDAGRITMRGRVAAMIELSAGFNPLLTGRENIFNQAALLGFSQSETRARFDEIVAFSEIEHALDMPLQSYSSGMKVRLGFSVYSHLEPDVLLIDEVLAVGDVGFRSKSLNKMSELLNRCAVIFVTHSMPQVFRVCNEVILLDHGRARYQGTDVALGVSHYFDAFAQGKQAVTGSGDAVVENLIARSTTGTASLSGTLPIDFGRDIEISVALQLKAPLRSARIQLLAWNTELVPVMDIMDDDLQAFRFQTQDDGRATIHVRLQGVNLNAGKYNLTVIVLSDDGRLLCRHDGAVALNIAAHCASGAHVVHVADWSASSGQLAQEVTSGIAS